MNVNVASPAELVARAAFAVRRTEFGPGSVPDERLRSVLAEWARSPDADLDAASLLEAATELRTQGSGQGRWADLLEAVAREDQWAVTVARYQLGESSQQLARELGISDSTLLAKLSRSRVPVRASGGSRHDEVTKAAAIAMYNAGASAREVAARHSASKNAILEWVRANGGEVRSPRTRRRH